MHLYRKNSEDQEQEDLADSPEIYLKNPTSYIESNHNQDDHFYVETKLSPHLITYGFSSTKPSRMMSQIIETRTIALLNLTN